MLIDKLYERVKERGVVCIGLDTDYEYIPGEFARSFESVEESLFNFNRRIIDATLDTAACYKVQIAYYEAYGLDGLRAYSRTLNYLREKDAVIVADIKRGDIAKTAEMYAKAHFTGDFESDFITVNPYMGMDSIEPYLPYVKNNEKGLFVLVRTSNKGAQDIEYIKDENGNRVYKVVGSKINELGREYMGNCGYSSIGGVMGCTQVEEAVEMRKNLADMFFLIPGYGAQGGRADDIALYLKNGNGGIVNASRSILLAYKKVEGGSSNFDECSRLETLRMRNEIASACRKNQGGLK